ncbi:MAG: hemerythrin domain-containing protein [Bacteroidetes bacterium]|nr:hemerythrin domain-containing protein [Bacteroidota bacterium]
MSVEWKEAYCIGHTEIDHQHKTIFLFLSEFEKTVPRGNHKELLHQSIEFLKDYIAKHFGFEEDCMFRFQCPIASENKEAHRKFLVAFERIVQRYGNNEDPSILLKEIQTTVNLWLVNHIVRIDSQLRHSIQN